MSGPADDLTYAEGVAAPGQCWRKENPDERWIFSVSGQVNPRITIKAGQAQVWHLANIGADVTYRLRLETLEKIPRRLAFDVRALDGAAFPPDQTDRRHTEIVLMPSARVEVLVRRCDRAPASGAGVLTDCVDPSQRVEARLRTVGAAINGRPSIWLRSSSKRRQTDRSPPHDWSRRRRPARPPPNSLSPPILRLLRRPPRLFRHRRRHRLR